MKLTNRKDAEIAMSLVSMLVLLDLANLDDAIAIMSNIEDIMKVPGGEYISYATSILCRN